MKTIILSALLLSSSLSVASASAASRVSTPSPSASQTYAQDAYQRLSERKQHEFTTSNTY